MFSSVAILLVGEVEFDHAWAALVQGHGDDVDGLEVGMGAAKHSEDGFLIAAAKDRTDPALASDEDDDNRHRAFLDGGVDAGHAGIVGRKSLQGVVACCE